MPTRLQIVYMNDVYRVAVLAKEQYLYVTIKIKEHICMATHLILILLQFYSILLEWRSSLNHWKKRYDCMCFNLSYLLLVWLYCFQGRVPLKVNVNDDILQSTQAMLRSVQSMFRWMSISLLMFVFNDWLAHFSRPLSETEITCKCHTLFALSLQALSGVTLGKQARPSNNETHATQADWKIPEDRLRFCSLLTHTDRLNTHSTNW